jgi:hypothetical protein
MISLILPQQVAGRDLADLMVDRLGPMDGQDVCIDARATVYSSPSFVSQCVQRILVDGQANVLIVDGGSSRFLEQLRQAAAEMDVEPRLQIKGLASTSA